MGGGIIRGTAEFSDNKDVTINSCSLKAYPKTKIGGIILPCSKYINIYIFI